MEVFWKIVKGAYYMYYEYYETVEDMYKDAGFKLAYGTYTQFFYFYNITYVT